MTSDRSGSFQMLLAVSKSGTLYHPVVHLCVAHAVYKNVELSFIDMGNKRKGLPHNMP
jgi:hypothetical protein